MCLGEDEHNHERHTAAATSQSHIRFCVVPVLPATHSYEFGYSLHSPHQLNIWEAQFGDFANGAQVIIDQFLSASERKWYRMSGLVMLLPHGYDGGGPEHSSARIERYLQAVDEEEYAMPQMHEDVRNQIQMANWQVVNCTTPANYFHALRRQVQRDFRKPMIVAAPKSLLRHPRCVSDLADMAEGTKFKRVLPDKSAASQNAADVSVIVDMETACGRELLLAHCRFWLGLRAPYR